MMKTQDLIGPALDWAVSAARGDSDIHPYSTEWADGGPIIERERLCVYNYGGDQWGCDDNHNLNPRFVGPTPLIAAMRFFVASVFGDEIEVPKEIEK